MKLETFGSVTKQLTAAGIFPYQWEQSQKDRPFSTLLALSSSTSTMYLFQYQCCLHTLSVISSTGTPFVSGKRKMTKMAMMSIQPPKKKKMPDFMWHIIERKA
ncbi:hypothetical protein HPP92_007756 [Vanilla planifolia]|uniref:Uncharacterized protein n=1 Tax=Vanilla planifolia TaxID=51239 RepID=A0A835V963_VANPL|nr:hypothetical protein HPP92_007909 [Vanilla planifolia]KAG0490893.1 hypothetical protein HPP92_007756 [Vanilla planifolia]